MAFAGEGDPEKIKKLRKYAKKIGVNEKFFSDSPIVKIEIKELYEVKTLDDLKLLPKDIQNKLFTQTGFLRKQYRDILEYLLSAGDMIPEGLNLENYASHLAQIGIINRERPPNHPYSWRYRMVRPDIARVLISGYHLPLWKR